MVVIKKSYPEEIRKILKLLRKHNINSYEDLFEHFVYLRKERDRKTMSDLDEAVAKGKLLM